MKYFFFLIYCAIDIVTHAQSSSPDTSFIPPAIQNSIRHYEASLNRQSMLYSGSAYIEPERTNETHPFFLSDDWLDGDISYNHQLYTGVSLLYDIYSDKIVTELFRATPMALVPEKVNAFRIQDHRFIRIQIDSSDNGLPRSGFYEQLYDGPTTLLALRQKERSEKIESAVSIEISFDERFKYYVLKNGVYHAIKSKASILKILADRKAELKKHIAQNHLDFAHNKEKAMHSIVRYYDTINGQ